MDSRNQFDALVGAIGIFFTCIFLLKAWNYNRSWWWFSKTIIDEEFLNHFKLCAFTIVVILTCTYSIINYSLEKGEIGGKFNVSLMNLNDDDGEGYLEETTLEDSVK